MMAQKVSCTFLILLIWIIVTVKKCAYKYTWKSEIKAGVAPAMLLQLSSAVTVQALLCPGL